MDLAALLKLAAAVAVRWWRRRRARYGRHARERPPDPDERNDP